MSQKQTEPAAVVIVIADADGNCCCAAAATIPLPPAEGREDTLKAVTADTAVVIADICTAKLAAAAAADDEFPGSASTVSSTGGGSATWLLSRGRATSAPAAAGATAATEAAVSPRLARLRAFTVSDDVPSAAALSSTRTDLPPATAAAATAARVRAARARLHAQLRDLERQHNLCSLELRYDGGGGGDCCEFFPPQLPEGLEGLLPAAEFAARITALNAELQKRHGRRGLHDHTPVLRAVLWSVFVAAALGALVVGLMKSAVASTRAFAVTGLAGLTVLTLVGALRVRHAAEATVERHVAGWNAADAARGVRWESERAGPTDSGAGDAGCRGYSLYVSRPTWRLRGIRVSAGTSPAGDGDDEAAIALDVLPQYSACSSDSASDEMGQVSPVVSVSYRSSPVGTGAGTLELSPEEYPGTDADQPGPLESDAGIGLGVGRMQQPPPSYEL
ncbi:hypothetical protein HK405_007771 [Cladochytrium tenue]|nr:hypothetical protein HK405_007771 [Cladochytrium tenue]